MRNRVLFIGNLDGGFLPRVGFQFSCPTFRILVFSAVALSLCVHTTARAQASRELPARVKAVFVANCYRCHGDNGASDGGMAYVTDLAKLVEHGKVVPGKAAGSKLYKKMASEADPMPPALDDDGKPVAPRPTREEIELIKQWIDAGAPADVPVVAAARAFVAEADVIQAITLDLAAADEHDRPFRRYFTITHLYNAGLNDDELQTYRGALSKLVNSLSWGRRIVAPKPIDPAKTVFRIDLRDYKWSEKVWREILASYPYGVTYADRAARGVYGATACDLPYVRGDWFVFAASRPPLYYQVLEVPAHDSDLENLLRVDVIEDIHAERVARAAFNGSGVSRNNRLLERHESTYGAYWKSYDFKDPAANERKNIFSHPLGPGQDNAFFQQDGGEIIFNLPNGLQAYMLVNAKGERLDKGPIEVVSDPKQADRSVVNGVSCMSCHSAGMIEKDDQLRAAVLRSPAGYPNAVVDKVKTLYKPKQEFDALLSEDKKRFLDALAATGVARTRDEPVFALARQFEQDLDLKLAAAEAGVKPEVFRGRVFNSPRLAGVLAGLNIPGGTVQRSVFVASFPALVSELSPTGTFLRIVPAPDEISADRTLANTLGMKLVRIEAGEFKMGTPPNEAGHSDDEALHEVKITKPFLMAATMVTQAQWTALMGNNPSHFHGDNLPVEQVSWNDAIAFCELLSQKEGKHYRLPTEAEWEYACRAGTVTPFNTGATISTDQANYDGRQAYGAGVKGKDREKTTPVGSFKPNAWGLYDMHGNVWQWCSDFFGPRHGDETDPKGPNQGDQNATRVLRGGSWRHPPRNCRSGYRINIAPGHRHDDVGFRVVMDSE